MNVQALIAFLQRKIREGEIDETYHIAVWVRDSLGHGEAKDLTFFPKPDIDTNEEFIAFELD